MSDILADDVKVVKKSSNHEIELADHVRAQSMREFRRWHFHDSPFEVNETFVKGNDTVCSFCWRKLEPPYTDAIVVSHVIDSFSICIDCVNPLIKAIGFLIGLDAGTRASLSGEGPITSSSTHSLLKRLNVDLLTGFIHGREALSTSEADYWRDKTTEAAQEIARLKRQVARAIDKNNRPGFVYLLLRDDGCHKIGISINPVQRLHDLQRDFPSAMMIHTLKSKDYREAETVLHQRYDEKRKDGEWFMLDTEDVAYIRSLRGYVSGEGFRVKQTT